mmetsp:Transcript_13660/g.19905  ORF Transcript_13660/g.19905 Transcript_13660/m.19905 type:complete len:96 (+) Transcript_13660:430-717(+)
MKKSLRSMLLSWKDDKQNFNENDKKKEWRQCLKWNERDEQRGHYDQVRKGYNEHLKTHFCYSFGLGFTLWIYLCESPTLLGVDTCLSSNSSNVID